MIQCSCGKKFIVLPHQFVRCHKCGTVLQQGDPSAVVVHQTAWGLLHSYAPTNAIEWSPAVARQWYQDEWKPLIPSCGECRQHWAELEAKHPPDFSSPQAFFKWAWARHDDVSRLHSQRPRISLDQAYALFWPSSDNF